MIFLLLVGCGLVILYISSDIVGCLAEVKFVLVVMLPGGIAAQESSANSQTAVIAAFIWQAMSTNMMVNSL